MELKQIKNTKHQAIIKCINEGIDNKTVMKRFGISRPSFFRIKQRYNNALTELQSSDITPNEVAEYSTKLLTKSKFITLKIADALIKKNYVGSSLGQLTTSLVNVNSMVRLEEGKSTENIAHAVLHNLNPDQLALIKDAVMNLKKSMLSS